MAMAAAVQGDAGSDAGSPEGCRASPEGRRSSVKFAQEGDVAGTKSESRRPSAASSASSTSTVERRRSIDPIKLPPSADLRSSYPGFMRSMTSPSMRTSMSSGDLSSSSRRESKLKDADKLKDAAVAAEVTPQSHNIPTQQSPASGPVPP